MTLQQLYDFCDSKKEYDWFDNAWEVVEEVCSENGVSANDLNWDEYNTMYVDLVYDHLEMIIDNFNSKFINFVKDKEIESEIKKQLGE